MEPMTTGSGVVRTIQRNRATRRLRREDGQTPTEYLMIVGIMAAVILIAFVFFFWESHVKPAAQTWSGQAAGAIKSSEGKQTSPSQ